MTLWLLPCDRLRPARGIKNGCLVSIAVWAVVIFVTWAVMRAIDFAIAASWGWRP